MDDANGKVNEIWETVNSNSKNRQLLLDWVDSFSGSHLERVQQAKQEIKDSLTDTNKSFLWRLMSEEPSLYGYSDRNGERSRRLKLGILFLRNMIEDRYWEDFLVRTLGHIYLEDGNNAVLSDELHKAARLEKVEAVRMLLKAGVKVQRNDEGYTPLHSAAMAITPNAEIAKLLLGSNSGGRKRLNVQTKEEFGYNTALHIAAGNVNVTKEFIQQFQEADTQCRNSIQDTPFHVAAKSRNPDIIIYMLNTFAPTNKGWDVDKVDKGQYYKYKIINICARNGNAKAVSLLIKHGADISKGVLQEIVLESVRNPEKIDKLVGVYQSIVDNAVTWLCLEEETAFLKFHGSEDYLELFRKTMIWLLTNHVKDDDGEELYEGRDVLRCALAHGASGMFWQIINTKSVFRTDGQDVWKWIDDESIDRGKDQKTWKDIKKLNWTAYDVTNFMEETRSKTSDAASATIVVKDSSESTALCPGHPQDTSHELSLIAGQENDHLTSESYVDRENTGNNNHPERNFDDLPRPYEPYLTYMLMAFHHWKNSNILRTQPLKGLIRPHIALVQRFCFLMGLQQLIFMILFTTYNMPTPCSLALMFNLSSTSCGSRTTNSSDNEMPSTASQQRSSLAWLWLIWPTILSLGSLHIIFYRRKLAYLAHRSHKTVVKSKDIKFSLVKQFNEALVPILLLIFCCMVWLWIYKYFRSDTYISYVEVTGMVLLLGWITNLAFFGVMSKDACIFALVVSKIIVKNIPSFMLFFVFIVVGFSFAMHTFRMSACSPNELMHLDETFFSVLSGAFGIGDFFEVTMTDSKCALAGTKYLIEFVYFCYVCATMIILLNILIAMMNNSYEKAKRRAGNTWRFQMLSLVTVLESHNCLVTLMTKLGILDLWRPGENLKKVCRLLCGLLLR